MTSITNVTDAFINIIRRTIFVTCRPTVAVDYIAYHISQTQLIPNEADSVLSENVVRVGETLNAYRILVGKREEKGVIWELLG